MVWWCPSVRVSVCPSQFSALFYYMLWHIDLKFCVSLYFYARKIKFECHQFLSLFAGVMLLFHFKLLQICSFPHFSPICFDILSSNFVYDFVLMYHRASLSVVILLQFLLELCLFVNLKYSKYTVFRTFLLHALTYWAEILHMTLFYCTQGSKLTFSTYWPTGPVQSKFYWPDKTFNGPLIKCENIVLQNFILLCLSHILISIYSTEILAFNDWIIL